MSEQTVYISLNNHTIAVTSARKDFVDYLQKQFRYQIIEKCSADIQVNMSWEKGKIKKTLSVEDKALKRIATNTYINDNECIYMQKLNGRRTKVQFSLKDKHLSLSVCQEDKWYKGLFKSNNDELMREACYHFVYYPLFFYLQHFSDIHPLHAGAFMLLGKTFVYSGMDRMGKTTLALESLAQEGESFISDNIIFHDDKNISPCYAPLKVRNEDEKHIPESFREITKAEDRTYFAPPASSFKEYTPDYVIIPYFSDQHFIEEIAHTKACSIILNSDILASEMNEYLDAATLWSLVTESKPAIVRQSLSLEELLKKTKCYHLGIARGEKPSTTIERLQKLIN